MNKIKIKIPMNTFEIKPTFVGRLYLLWQVLTKKKITVERPFFNVYCQHTKTELEIMAITVTGGGGSGGLGKKGAKKKNKKPHKIKENELVTP